MRVVSAIADTVATSLKPVFGVFPWFIIKIQVSYQLHLAYAKGHMPDLSGRKPHYTAPIKSIKEAIKTGVTLLKLALKLSKTRLPKSVPPVVKSSNPNEP